MEKRKEPWDDVVAMYRIGEEPEEEMRRSNRVNENRRYDDLKERSFQVATIKRMNKDQFVMGTEEQGLKIGFSK